MWRLIALVIMMFTLSGCSDVVKKYINEKYPPVSNEEQRSVSQKVLISSLSKITNPGISVGISIAELETRLLNDPYIDRSIRDIKLYGNKQLLDAEITFDKTFTSDEWENDENFKDILKGVDFQVRGSLKFSVGLKSSEVINDAGITYIEIVALPSINSIKIEKFKVIRGSEDIDIKIAAKLIDHLINTYKDNTAGFLSSQPFMRTKIPQSPLDASNPAGLIGSSGSEQKEIQFQGNKLNANPDLILRNLTFLIDDQFISMMIEIVPDAKLDVAKSELAFTDFDSARQVYYGIHETVFGEKHPSPKFWVAVSNASLAYVINETIPETTMCFNQESSIPRQRFSEKIKLPHEDSISCDSERDCRQERDCSFDTKKDSRSCSACLLRAPKVCLFGGCTGGQCIQEGNDPLCEAAKAAQNILYKAETAGKKADCERLKTQKKLICEVEKTAEKGFCEAGKEVVKRINRTGNFGNISGDLEGTAQVEICSSNPVVSKDLSTISSQLSITGKAHIKGDVKFTPLDIVGHLTCVMPANTPINVRLSVPQTQIEPTVKLSFLKKESKFGISFLIEGFELPFSLKPSLTEILLKSPELTFKCQGLNLIKPLIITAHSFVPELQGNFIHKQDTIEGFLKLDLPKQEIFNQKVDIDIRAGDKAVFLAPIPQSVTGPG